MASFRRRVNKTFVLRLFLHIQLLPAIIASAAYRAFPRGRGMAGRRQRRGKHQHIENG